MELKKFRNKYDLELIPASTSNIIVGTLVWDPVIGKPDVDHPGLPEHIFNAFLDADLVNQDEWADYLQDARNESLVVANFAERSVDVDMALSTSLEQPQIGKIGHAFNLKSVKKFAFGDLQPRTMSNLLRVKIDDYLEDMKKSKWALYDGKIRRVFMVTELYYGSIKLVIEKELKDEFSASIKKVDVAVENTVELAKSVEYTFAHEDVPFAMRIEAVRKFNG